jgi:hypothetical protein
MPRVGTLRRSTRVLAGCVMAVLLASLTGAVGVRTAAAASGWFNQNVVGPPTTSLAMAYDSVHHVVLAFDGTRTWTWTTSSRTWTSVTSAHNPSTGSVFFSMTFDSARGKTVMIASGYGPPVNPTNLLATWEWDGADWIQLSPAHNPPARYGAAPLVFDSKRGVVILFSGQFDQPHSPGDTWEWNGTDWTDRTTATGPNKRYTHCMAYDAARGVTVLFGGFANSGSSSGSLSDTWEYDGTTWILRGWTGIGPAGFAACNMVYDSVLGRVIDFTPKAAAGNTLVLEPFYWNGSSWVDANFPGPSTTGGASAYDAANDTVVLDLQPVPAGSPQTWLLNPPPPPPPGWVNQNASGPPPVAMTYDSTRQVILAIDGSHTANYNTVSKTWTTLSTVNHPSGSGGVNFAMAFDSGRGKAVVVASPIPIGQPVTNFTTTWEWDGTDWTQLNPAHNPPARSGFQQSLVYDAKRGVTVLFSGQLNGVPGDTWEWNGTDWADRTTSTGPIGRQNQCLSYDSKRNVTVLYGGFENLGSGAVTLTDTWEYDGTSWTLKATSGGPSSFDCSLVYDPVLSRTIGLANKSVVPTSQALEPYYWDGASWVDTLLPGPGEDGFTAVYDTANDAVVVDLFPLTTGGPETWLFNPSPPPPPGGGGGPPPVVSGVSPDHGPASGLTSVTIAGTGFTGATAMSFRAGEVPLNLCGQQPAGVGWCFTVVSDTQITAISPPLPLGSWNVYVVTPNGLSAYSTADIFSAEGWDSSTPANLATFQVAKNPGQPTTFTMRLLEGVQAHIGHTPLPSWITCADTSNPAPLPGSFAQVDCSISPTSTDIIPITFSDLTDPGRVPSRTVTIRVIYQPNPSGYQFGNLNDQLPSYASMAADYPASANEMYWPIIGGQTFKGQLFFNKAFKPLMAGGLCYGIAATSAYFYNDYGSAPLDLYKAFGTNPAAPLPFAFDGQNGVSIQTMIERYHSRQFAQLGGLDSAARYKQALAAGNIGVFQQLVAAVAKQPITVGIVPSKSVSPLRWWPLFWMSHQVVAYDTSIVSGQRQIKVYDPNSPNDPNSVLTIDNQGGLTLTGANGATYGSGLPIKGGGDFGKPSEWQAVPIPDFTWSDGSTASIGPFVGVDNRHWILDSPQTPFVVIFGAATGTIPSLPLLIAEAGSPSQLEVDQVPAGTSFAATLSTSAANATVGQFTDNHVALVSETDPGAPGTSHGLAIDAPATRIHLSGASTTQQYTLQLGADYLPGYGRMLTLNGTTLAPNTTLDAGTDAGTNAFTLSSTGADQLVAASLQQAGTGAAATTVQALIPGAGGQAAINVSDWNDVAHSLVYETIVRNGQLTVRVLQDNPAQRQGTVESLFTQLTAAIVTIPNEDLRKGLDAAVQVALYLDRKGDLKNATAILLGLEHVTALLVAKHAIAPATAATMISLSQQIRGLL